jgi:YidC/Oxa1 family membrane protein insertase
MWDWFIDFLTGILTQLTAFCGDWGLAIIILTVIIRLLLTPLTVRQVRSTTYMSLMQPKIQEAQERYANDQERLAQELQKIYAENKINPLGGCLPVLLQMPVFFALFTVLKNLPADANFYNILPQLSISVADRIGAIGFVGALPYVIIDVLFGVLTFIPMVLQQPTSPEQRSQTMMMGGIMAIMMIWIGWNLPVGVNLYYVTSAAWGVFQQLFITKRIRDKVIAEEEERQKTAPVVVDVVRKEKKPRPHKKS